ncbi:hypothetical protein CVCC1112_3424 [Paenarthrobacter nicotinovorans]|nr:hypothetical protein CVCC1112_3424 [Paenarthrobacter nicotinovorans]
MHLGRPWQHPCSGCPFRAAEEDDVVGPAAVGTVSVRHSTQGGP